MMSFKNFILESIKQVKTERGSIIKRSRLGVGKEIGGTFYLHSNYEDSIPDQELLKKAKAVLSKNFPSFKYNVLKYTPKTKLISFVFSPDFDISPEPTSGTYINIFSDGSFKKGHSDSIWHHKWLWVKDDYQGFDVEESFKRSQKWLQIPNIDFARIGNREVWNRDYLPKIT